MGGGGGSRVVRRSSERGEDARETNGTWQGRGTEGLGAPWGRAACRLWSAAAVPAWQVSANILAFIEFGGRSRREVQGELGLSHSTVGGLLDGAGARAKP